MPVSNLCVNGGVLFVFLCVLLFVQYRVLRFVSSEECSCSSFFFLRQNSHNIKFTIFKANGSVASSPFSSLCSCRLYPVLQRELRPGGRPRALHGHSPPHPTHWPQICFLSLWFCPFCPLHTNEVIHYVLFGVWFLSFNTVFPSLAGLLTRVRTSFLFVVELWFVVWVDHLLCIHHCHKNAQKNRNGEELPQLDKGGLQNLWLTSFLTARD